ncbi:MAG: SH3 domain-containing protein [bacterium]|nr:SH3 domain-containing protein [bacterium]
MWCRETRRVLFGWSLVWSLAVCLAATSARAREAPPIEVRSVELRTGETAGTVVIRSEKPVEWSTEAGERTLVVFLSHSVPGPEALDRSSRAGLISRVEVGFAVPGGVPTARITIHARKRFQHEIVRSGDDLTIRLAAVRASPGSSEKQVEAPSAPQTGGVSVENLELEAILEENEGLRERVAELHSDRLELRKSLDTRTAELEKAARSKVRTLLAEVGLGQLTISPAADPCLTVRAGPSMERERIDCLLPGTEVSITDVTTGWLSVTTPGGVSGWVASRFVEPRQAIEASERTPALELSRHVKDDVAPCLSLRQDPNVDSRLLDCLPPGTKAAAVASAGGWFRLRLQDGLEGWSAAEFLESTNERELRLELEAARSDLVAAEADSEELATRVAGLEADLAATRESLAASQARNESLATRIAELEAVAADTAAPAGTHQTVPTAIEEPTEVAEFPAPLPSVAEVIPEPALGEPTDLEAFVRVWARAWSEQRVDDYLSCYAASFIPPLGMSRADWSSLRRERLTSPEFIEIELTNFSTRIDGPDRATVSFDQDYRSDTFRDRVGKTLELIREGDRWRILEETRN